MRATRTSKKEQSIIVFRSVYFVLLAIALLHVVNGKTSKGITQPSEQKRLILYPANTFLRSKNTCPLFPIQQDGHFGYIDNEGRVRVEPQFEDASNFSEGLAAIKVNGKWGYISEQGRIVIEPRFERALIFSEGLGAVMISNHWEYIDKNGIEAFKRTFDLTKPFSEGMAMVFDYNTRFLIDRDGKTIVLNDAVDIQTGFSEGLAVVKLGGLEGYINKTGKIVIDPRFTGASEFVDGLALAQSPGGSEFGYIDRTGQYVIKPFITVSASPFYEGLAAVKLRDVTGYIDKTGAWVIKIDANELGDFCNGAAFVVPKGKGSSDGIYINRSGNQIWPRVPIRQ